MGGAGGVGTGAGWEARVGAVSRGCGVPGPQGEPLPVGFWWVADSQSPV